MISIAFPWFDKKLNPNARLHWAVKAKARSKQKTDAFWIAKAAKAPLKQDKYSVEIIFCPPDKRPRDLDNCLSACKGLIDGMCMAWGINDKDIQYSGLSFGKVSKGGRVLVILEDEE